MLLTLELHAMDIIKPIKRPTQQVNVSLVEYSPYQNNIYGVPGRGRTGSISMSLDNNIEMKVKSDKDTTGVKKISIIDAFGLAMSYNMAAKDRPWSDLSMNIRLKWWKGYTFNMNAVFCYLCLRT